MHRRSVDQYLLEIPLFSLCSHKEVGHIGRLATRTSFTAGRVLAEQGQPGHELVVIVDGTVVVIVDGVNVATLGPGDFFGEIALLNPGPRTATVIAETDVEACVIGRREFHGLIHEHPGVAIKMLAAVSARLRAADRHLVH
jgi:CRP/FNR family transcriptional regulator, cyclic AMP receptor protein